MLIKLSHDNKLKCYIHNGIHITINTIAELYHANENIKNYTSKSFWKNKSVLLLVLMVSSVEIYPNI